MRYVFFDAHQSPVGLFDIPFGWRGPREGGVFRKFFKVQVLAWFKWQHWRWLAAWTAVAAALHALWEVGHLPLYTLSEDPDRWRVTRYVLHCTLGDGLIAAGTYLVAALAPGRPRWPVVSPWRGGMLASASGVGYTALSEWINVYVTGGWAYTQAMPRVAGIGLTPLAQWVVVPSLTLLILRWLARRTQCDELL